MHKILIFKKYLLLPTNKCISKKYFTNFQDKRKKRRKSIKNYSIKLVKAKRKGRLKKIILTI